MILEVVRADGQRTWHRLTTTPLTVGRGFANDLILDDPYVDARHARIAVDESGAVVIEDLGSVNGLVAETMTLRGAIPVRPGVEVRLGRTTLRFRDADESVAPALIDERPNELVSPPASARTPLRTAPAARRPVPLAQWATTTAGRLSIAVVAIAAFALNAWLGSSARSGASAVFGGAFAFTFAAALWVAMWAVASRVVTQRFHYLAHFAVAAAAALVGLGWTILDEWLSFFFPDTPLSALLSLAVSFVVLVALIAGHLSLASNMPPRRRWRTGLVVAGTAFAVASLAALAQDESFSDIPKFSGVLKPVAPAWLPTTTIDDFGGVMRQVKQDVDELAAEQAVEQAKRGTR